MYDPEKFESTPQYHEAIAEYLPLLLKAQMEDSASTSALPELRLSEDEILWGGSLIVDKSGTINLYLDMFRGTTHEDGVSGYRDSQKPVLDPLLTDITTGYMDIKQQQSRDDIKDIEMGGLLLGNSDYDDLSDYQKEVLDWLGLGHQKNFTHEEEIASDLAVLEDIRSTALVELSHYVVRIPTQGAVVIENTLLSGETLDRNPDFFPSWIVSSATGDMLVDAWNLRIRNRISNIDRSYATEELTNIEKINLLRSIRDWANKRRTTGPENPRVRYARYLEIFPHDPLNPIYVRYEALAKLGYPVNLEAIKTENLPIDYSSDPEPFRDWERSLYASFVKPLFNNDNFIRFMTSPDYLDVSNYAFGKPEADQLLFRHPANIAYPISSGNCSYLYDWLSARQSGVGLEDYTKLPDDPSFDEFLEKAFITAFDRYEEWKNNGYPAAGTAGYQWDIDESKFLELKNTYTKIVAKGVVPLTHEDLVELFIDYYQLFETKFPDIRQYKEQSRIDIPNPYDEYDT